VIIIPNQPVYVVITKTATADTPFQLTYKDIWFKELDIFVYTNDADVGGIGDQDIWVNTNDIYTVKGPVNAKDLYFKNHTAGSNTKIVIAGTQLSNSQLLETGI